MISKDKLIKGRKKFENKPVFWGGGFKIEVFYKVLS